MPRLNIIHTIKRTNRNINPYYACGIEHIEVIKQKNSDNLFECMCDSFTLGYAQGVKAVKAQQKRGNAL